MQVSDAKDHHTCLFLDGTISEAIRELVRSDKISGGTLALTIGVDPSCITRFVNGGGINSQTVDKLAEHYGVGVAKRPKQ